MTLTYLSLFAGIGGLDLGLDRAGWACVGQVEKDPFCQRVLAKHWPEAPRHDDVTTAVTWWLGAARPAVRLVAGGYPCQGESVAGRRLAHEDERWLWPAMRDVVAALQPQYVVCENTLGHRTRGLATVLDDLDQLGYTTTAGVLRACEVGAPHPRPRLFVVAHAHSEGRNPGSRVEPARTPALGTGWWADEPRLARVAYGVSAGVDRRRAHRRRALGNAVAPQAAEHIGILIRRHAEQHLVTTETSLASGGEAR